MRGFNLVSVRQELSPGGVSIVRGFNLVSVGQELSPGGVNCEGF